MGGFAVGGYAKRLSPRVVTSHSPEHTHTSSLHSTPCSLHPTPCTLLPAPIYPPCCLLHTHHPCPVLSLQPACILQSRVLD